MDRKFILGIVNDCEGESLANDMARNVVIKGEIVSYFIIRLVTMVTIVKG